MTDAPAVRTLNRLHERALRERCSDIHVEPQPGGARVRFRVDGLLREAERVEEPLAAALVSRIKILAGMDIADRRLPQDGRYSVEHLDRAVDMRVSSVPARDGEKLVIRLLDRQARPPALEDLGMSAPVRAALAELLERASGFIVVCGPTGSGKTTTLYAAVAHLNRPERNICTVEDPVELTIPGVTQVQVNVKAGVTFGTVLRALVRQDPDVMLVGETRDPETADTAVSAALSGRLVLTTLHAADAPRAVERLGELGVARASLAAGLSAIVAQRLVRRLCPACAQAGPLDTAVARALGLDPARVVFAPRGCAACGDTGYAGRTAIFELLRIDATLREAIAQGASSGALSTLASERGYRRVLDDGAEKLLAGTTSVEELRRVVGWEERP